MFKVNDKILQQNIRLVQNIWTPVLYCLISSLQIQIRQKGVSVLVVYQKI